MHRISFIFGIVVALSLSCAAAEVPSLVVEADQSVGKVSPVHFGLMTEEINHSYDGGLYGELVQNRAFLDDPAQPVHWSVIQGNGAAAVISVEQDHSLNDVLTNSLRLHATSASESARAGAANDGYWGMAVRPRTKYRASFYARAGMYYKDPVRISLESDDGTTVFASEVVKGVGADWKKFSVTLKTGEMTPTSHARLVLSISHPGTVYFNLVSLFPPTYHDRPNGNRIDIMETLAAMKPAFLRFPGGNYVEGNTVDTRFDWKKTIGPLERRPGHASCWGYRSSDGMGLLEFLEWCEDLKMEPVLAVYAGYNLNHTHIQPGPALRPYVEDALDEIEYVTGGIATPWGAQRAIDGHPEPFPLHYVEIGNEDWFDRSGSYELRFGQFFAAIKKKYPNLQCISTIGNEHHDQMVRNWKPDLLDEHYYSAAAEFDSDSSTHWDNYDRTGPKIFVGEWAAYEDVKPWSPPSGKLPPTPALKSALADAAWMAGMERNSDFILMQCYAPLFVNVNPGARQWRPDLIGYNALNVYGSPSYYAIQMFSRNHGDTILKTLTSNGPLNYCATRDSQTGTIYLTIVNPESQPKSVDISVLGLASLDWRATATTLSSGDPYDSNSIDNPSNVVPVTREVHIIKSPFAYQFAPYSATILELHGKTH